MAEAISLSTLHIADLYRLLQRLDRIVARRRRVFVRDEAGEAESGNRLHDEAIVQLVRVVDLVASRIAAGVKMADPLEVILDVADDVTVHDLGVVDVVENLDAR